MKLEHVLIFAGLLAIVLIVFVVFQSRIIGDLQVIRQNQIPVIVTPTVEPTATPSASLSPTLLKSRVGTPASVTK